MMRLQWLGYPSQPFHLGAIVGHAMMQLWECMARQGQQLQLHLSATKDMPIVQEVLKRARQLGILTHLVIADRSCSSVDSSSNTSLLSGTDTLLFEILANPQLHVLELNYSSACPVTQGDNEDKANRARRMGHAIAANPSLQSLILYTYQDPRGTATAQLLQALVVENPKTSSNHDTGRGLKSLQLYCPKSATAAIVQDGLISLLTQDSCVLTELEITCIRHHHQHGTGVILAGDVTDIDQNQEQTLAMDVEFPLKSLVQEGLLRNSSLKHLGIFHAELTTAQVDRDLLCHLHKHPQLAYLDLFGNQIDSLYFPNFYHQSSQEYCQLEQLQLRHNPCLTQHPYQHQDYYYPLVTTSPLSSVPPATPTSSTFPPSTSSTSSISLTLVDMLCTLFQRHPCLFHFGLDPHQYFFSSSCLTEKLSPTGGCPGKDKIQSLLFLADANRLGLRKSSSTPVVGVTSSSARGGTTSSPATTTLDLPPLLPLALWPLVFRRMTQHSTLVLHPQPDGVAMAQAPTKLKKPHKNHRQVASFQQRRSPPLLSSTAAGTSPTSTFLFSTPTVMVGYKNNSKAMVASTAAHGFSPASSWTPLLSSSPLFHGPTNTGANKASQQPHWKKQSSQEQEQRRQRQASLMMEALRHYPTIWTTSTGGFVSKEMSG